ncbi:uncharacterized protein LOC118199672 isoform X5 [Stegodyphus dumicola]|uniref:uncharacterized protein LOC118199672 isoform X5 n=1 Tax=Stegodyphus dumicola TaxID=202533 RepID=UPI0015AD3A95|nr:uncharacterized protein LOC118199672 isoform X5 [Stegodyphus dumicola]
MHLKIKIVFNALAFLTIFFRTTGGNSQLLKFGSCSMKCQKTLSDASTFRIFPPHQCSCSRSCTFYGDCCYDSLYRTEVWKSREISCLHVQNKGRFQAVSSCAPAIDDMDVGCRSRVGELPPVTSKSSGVTYANIFCAFCNGDYDLQYWDVEYRFFSQNTINSIINNWQLITEWSGERKHLSPYLTSRSTNYILMLLQINYVKRKPM